MSKPDEKYIVLLEMVHNNHCLLRIRFELKKNTYLENVL